LPAALTRPAEKISVGINKNLPLVTFRLRASLMIVPMI